MTNSTAAPVGEGVASRAAALEVLARVDDDGAYANLVLGPVLDGHDLDNRDRALVTDLAYGTIRRRRSLEFLVDRFLSDRPSPAAYRALLLGAYCAGSPRPRLNTPTSRRGSPIRTGSSSNSVRTSVSRRRSRRSSR